MRIIIFQKVGVSDGREEGKGMRKKAQENFEKTKAIRILLDKK